MTRAFRNYKRHFVLERLGAAESIDVFSLLDSSCCSLLYQFQYSFCNIFLALIYGTGVNVYNYSTCLILSLF